jgi:hypothetical protein
MKYKQIKSVAHNFADSFVSSMNWADDDYVTGHLARAAVAAGEPELRVDLLTGDAEPSALLTAPVKASLESRVPWLDGLLRSHGAEIDAVREATMRMRFDLSRTSVPGLAPTAVPFECEVRITDDRGIVHTGTVRASAFLPKGAGTSQSA